MMVVSTTYSSPRLIGIPDCIITVYEITYQNYPKVLTRVADKRIGRVYAVGE